jgi:peptide/nickel transport system permease protein
MKQRVAALMLAVLIAVAAVIVMLPSADYAKQDREAIMAGATHQHWMGTDEVGRDRSVRVAAALLLGLAGAAAAALVTIAIATGVGALAAFSRPSVAWILMLASDLFLSLPWLFLLMMVRSFLPLTTSQLNSAIVTFTILAALGWPACARAVYRGSLNLRSAEWMIQGRASGLRTTQLFRRHLLPHLRPLLIPQFLIWVPAFIVAEANLGTLGLGIAAPLPSWGAMLQELDNSASLALSHWVYLPIIVLIVVLLLLESLSVEV